MLYLKNITDAQELMIPRDGDMSSGFMSLILKSTIDMAVRSFQVSSDRTSQHYFKLSVNLQADMPNGEYEYSLMNGQILLSRGLLIIGENVRMSEYNNTITYEQYESD